MINLFTITINASLLVPHVITMISRSLLFLYSRHNLAVKTPDTPLQWAEGATVAPIRWATAPLMTSSPTQAQTLPLSPTWCHHYTEETMAVKQVGVASWLLWKLVLCSSLFFPLFTIPWIWKAIIERRQILMVGICLIYLWVCINEYSFVWF